MSSQNDAKRRDAKAPAGHTGQHACTKAWRTRGLFGRMALMFGGLMVAVNLLLMGVFVLYFSWYIDTMDLARSLDKLVLKTAQRFEEPAFPEAFAAVDTEHLRGRLRYLGSFEDTASMRVVFVFPDNTAARYSGTTETSEFSRLEEKYAALADDVRANGSARVSAFHNHYGLNEFIRGVTVESPLGGCAVILVCAPIDALFDATGMIFVVMLANTVVSALLAIVMAYYYASRLTGPLSAVTKALSSWQKQEFASVAHGNVFGEIEALSETMSNVAESLSRDTAARSQFFSRVSHELKTPVASIRAQAELLADGLAETPAEQHEYHVGILRETQHLQHLVEDLLTLSRLQSAEYDMTMEPCCPVEIWADAVHACRPLAREKDIDLRFIRDIPVRAAGGTQHCENGLFLGNYTRIRQLATILIENAIKYTPLGKAITVQLKQTADGLCATVMDEGPGIPEAEREQVFFSGYRGSNVGTVSGSGLGLAIARQIALRMSIRLELCPPGGAGEGAKFDVFFPADRKVAVCEAISPK